MKEILVRNTIQCHFQREIERLMADKKGKEAQNARRCACEKSMRGQYRVFLSFR